MTSGSRSSPAITSAGSPGNRCCNEKIRIETKNSVGISCRMRLERKFSMGLLSLAQLAGPRPLQPRKAAGSTKMRCIGLATPKMLQPSSLELQADDAHQSVRHLLVALEFGGVRNQDFAVVDIKNRVFVERELREIFIDGLAFALLRDKPRAVERFVSIGIGPGAVILRRAGSEEDVGIAVGVDPAAPRQHERLVFAGFGLLQRSRELGDPDLHVETGLRRHRLDHLRDGFGFGALWRHEIDIYRRSSTGLLQQRLGLRDIARANRKLLLVIRMIGIDPLVARLEFAIEHNLIDGFAIDRQIERLAYLGGLAERPLGFVLADIQRHALIAEFDRGG